MSSVLAVLICLGCLSEPSPRKSFIGKLFTAMTRRDLKMQGKKYPLGRWMLSSQQARCREHVRRLRPRPLSYPECSVGHPYGLQPISLHRSSLPRSCLSRPLGGWSSGGSTKFEESKILTRSWARKEMPDLGSGSWPRVARLRTNGVNTKWAAARVMNFDRLGNWYALTRLGR